MTVQTSRPYQARIIDAVFTGWDSGLQRVGISMATGGGKSHCFAKIAVRHLENHPEAGPVVLLAHRKELIHQAATHFSRANPELKVEVVIGSPGPVRSAKRELALRRWRRADVLVSSPQTLASASTIRDFPNPSLVIIDEAHHAPANQWKKVLTSLGCFSGVPMLGVTATPFREDHRDLEPTIIERFVATVDILWLIHHRLDEAGNEVECEPGEGYLVPPRLQHLLVDGLDLSQVPTSRKSGAVDFREGELAEALEASGAFDLVAKTIISEMAGRKGVIFCPTVASSKYMAALLTELGEPCHHVDGTMDTRSRDTAIGEFRDDSVRWLANVAIVSEGFDIPEIDTVVLAKPTRSRIFFRQAIGRALRPAPGKDHALILDVVGASEGQSLAGVNALTDNEVLTAKPNEQLLELAERTDRTRQGWRDRIQALLEEILEAKDAGEMDFNRITLTADNLADQVAGCQQFVDRAQPHLDRLLEVCTAAEELAATVTENRGMRIHELARLHLTMQERSSNTRPPRIGLEEIKARLRETLMAMRETPDSPVTLAMVTGYTSTVRGQLFGEEEERRKPSAPGIVNALKAGGRRRGSKASHAARKGWAMQSDAGHYFIPVYEGREVIELAVVVHVPESSTRGVESWWPVKLVKATNQLDVISPAPLTFQRVAIQAAASYAADRGTTGFINPNAPWRKRPCSDQARATAMRISPQVPIPPDATAGYVADIIAAGQHNHLVDTIGAYVVEKMAL